MKILTLAWIALAFAPTAFGGKLPFDAKTHVGQIAALDDSRHSIVTVDSPLLTMSMGSAGGLSANVLAPPQGMSPPQLNQFLFLLLFLLLLIAAVEFGMRGQSGPRFGSKSGRVRQPEASAGKRA